MRSLSHKLLMACCIVRNKSSTESLVAAFRPVDATVIVLFRLGRFGTGSGFTRCGRKLPYRKRRYARLSARLLVVIDVDYFEKLFSRSRSPCTFDSLGDKSSKPVPHVLGVRKGGSSDGVVKSDEKNIPYLLCISRFSMLEFKGHIGVQRECLLSVHLFETVVYNERGIFNNNIC